MDWQALWLSVKLSSITVLVLIPLAILTLEARETVFWVAIATLMGGVAQLLLDKAKMQQDPLLRDIPIVFLTAIVSREEAKSKQLIGGYEAVDLDEVLACAQRAAGRARAFRGTVRGHGRFARVPSAQSLCADGAHERAHDRGQARRRAARVLVWRRHGPHALLRF